MPIITMAASKFELRLNVLVLWQFQLKNVLKMFLLYL